ncbi:MAG: 16S rRNA (guanine(966)-N(2))-methyltransferase RsmD [Bacteroidetes bacterium]|nr:MAG: 16S rRNA (guanine(966)-N(2))-methyltransferase RsmD [Bacteroidota bacterium]MBL1144187.1 16S rRNA (guanine(966)-N(2))-methyltransferase RsmD [Bacteroidota bacterium]NOG56983.1 16S rRNA (guanine(966)-N(2))-methyltransferase RsmD [Bacteroidota bacterium]
MRIISGTLKGRKILAPKNLPVRPTTDFAKEALFNLLRNKIDIEEIDVLDLFAGTGNLSLEFISRGAKSCLSVDQNTGCIKFMQKTSKDFELKNWRILRDDVFKFIKKGYGQYDLIFADPPYDLELLTSLPRLIFEKGLLKDEGLLVLEHGKEHSFENHERLLFTRRYGNVNFTLFS